jgi:hypothetical protein
MRLRSVVLCSPGLYIGSSFGPRVVGPKDASNRRVAYERTAAGLSRSHAGRARLSTIKAVHYGRLLLVGLRTAGPPGLARLVHCLTFL